jgi:hypothetical protein
VTLDDCCSIAIAIVPAAMQPPVASIEFGTRAAIIITVAIVFSVASDLLSSLHWEKTIGRPRRSWNRFGTFLNG